MSCWALVPVKARAEGKSRLAPVLDPPARIALVRSMLDHVLGVLAAAPGVDHVAIASPERDLVSADIHLLPERGRGLNRALGSAVAALRRLGAREVLVLPGDLPCVGTDDVAVLLAQMRAGGCALASDRQGTGTNAIALDLQRLGPAGFRFLFGRNSFARHARQACALGLGPQIARRPGLGFDLDEPQALSAFKTVHRPDAIRQAS
jgi:2-phospho-L-lactate guanylyltransferase